MNIAEAIKKGLDKDGASYIKKDNAEYIIAADGHTLQRIKLNYRIGFEFLYVFAPAVLTLADLCSDDWDSYEAG